MIRGPCVVCYEDVTTDDERLVKRCDKQNCYAHKCCVIPDSICAYKQCRKSIHPTQITHKGMHESCAAAKRRDENRALSDNSNNATCYYTCAECKHGFDDDTDYCRNNGKYLCQICHYKILKVGTCAVLNCSKPLMQADYHYIRSDGHLVCENCEEEHVDWDQENERYRMRCDFWGIPR